MNVGETFAMVRMSVEERGFRESVRIPHSRLRRGEAGSGNEARITVLPKKGGRDGQIELSRWSSSGDENGRLHQIGRTMGCDRPSVRPSQRCPTVRIRRQSE